MEKSILVLLAVLLSGSIFSQESSPYNIGFSFPFFFKSSLYNDNDYQSKTWISGNNFFVEKANIIGLTEQKRLLFTPGISYSYYSERMASPSSALGGWSGKSFKHKAFSVYNKFLFRPNFHSKKNSAYFGIVTGVYIYSKTKGNESGAISGPYGNHYSDDYNKNGKLFFNSFYWGVLGKVEPKLSRNSLIHPSMEISFFPYYAKLLDPGITYSSLEKSNSMLSVSVILGLSIKKATQK